MTSSIPVSSAVLATSSASIPASGELKHTSSVRKPSRASRRAFSAAISVLPVPAPPMIDARRMLRSVFRRLNCSAVSLTTFDSPSAISLRSIGVISKGALIVATRRSIATLPGGWVFDPPLQASNARSTKLPSSARPASVSTKVDWSAIRSASTSGPSRPSRPRIVSISTCGNATAWPEIGVRRPGQPGNSCSLSISEWRLSAACSNGLRGSGCGPAHQRPSASRRISPALTSITRIPRLGSPITMSASPSRTRPFSRRSQRTWGSSATLTGSTARRRSNTRRSAIAPRASRADSRGIEPRIPRSSIAEIVPAGYCALFLPQSDGWADSTLFSIGP